MMSHLRRSTTTDDVRGLGGCLLVSLGVNEIVRAAEELEVPKEGDKFSDEGEAHVLVSHLWFANSSKGSSGDGLFLKGTIYTFRIPQVCSEDLFGGVLLQSPYLRDFEERQMFFLHLLNVLSASLPCILKGSCCLPIVCIVGVAGCGTGLKLGSDSLGTLQIYVPMNQASEHWYLAVVLIDEKTVHMVDSLPDINDTTEREGDIREMIQHCGSYERMRLAKDLIMDPSNYAWNMIHERVSRDTPKFEYVINQYIEEKIKKDDQIEKMARFYELAERCENDVE
ncbi:hypothetical protein LINPERPRIM_LOCUS40489 [Linum perenne]